MENVNFQPSGEDIERALMDLGPLLGVTIKEEVQDELPDPNAQPPSQLNVGNITEAAAGVAGPSNESGEPTEPHDKGSADSLASPTAGRVQLSSARCVMCQGTLALTDGTPKLMECLHSACEPCIKSKIEERAATREFLANERITITCPICRLQCQPANMIDQRFVIEKIATEQTGSNGTTSGEQQCNSCEDTEPATSYCVDCAEFICDNCVHAHQRLKITKDHTIKSKEEAMAELQAAQTGTRSANDMFCREHIQERLSLFCETCDRLTCRDCQLQHHRDHKYQFSTEMAAQARSSIASLLSEVSYKRVLLGSAMKVIRDRQQLIADKKKALVHDITQTVVKLTNAINTRGKQLVLRLNEVCDAKQRTLSEKKEALEQLAAITDHCVEFVNAALEQGSDTAVLYTKHSVCAHLQRIKSRRADIPNPEIPVRINLALDKLPELVKVLSNIGAIVVDGKVDGGCGGTSSGTSGTSTSGTSGTSGGTQGPYHQSNAPPPPSALANNNNSAVVALQHVAMHQPFASSGGAYLGVAALRARAHTPLRHPHVTSTTHPHHLHGMNEMNLRGLLNAASGRGGAVHTPRQHAPLQHPPHPPHPQHPQHSAQAAMHHAYQQMMGVYASNAYANSGACGGRRSGGPRTPSPAPPAPPAAPPAATAPPPPPQYQHQHHHQPANVSATPAAKWHIPQHSLLNGGFETNMMSASQNTGGSDFKITLGRPQSAQAQAPVAGAGAGAAVQGAAGAGAGLTAATPRHHSGPSVVTSTNPKTPSPSLNGGASSELDKVCAESVQDLMATIAKLDSNGVQVVAEAATAGGDAGSGAAPSPAPHVHSSTDPAGKQPDPNEDWCAVCMDGGELMCCDKCPKVFHQYCHIPTIEKLPDETETWQCLLCVNFAELPLSAGDEELPPGGGLPPRAQKLVERVTLEMYCQYELSLPFREPVPAENLHYHSKISRPMCLDMIRMKLQPRSAARYGDVAQFVSDCRLLFRNAYRYNPPDSQFFKDAKRLEEFFDIQLVKWLPEYAYWGGEGEPPTKRLRVE